MLGKNTDKTCFLCKTQASVTAAQHGTWINTGRGKKKVSLDTTCRQMRAVQTDCIQEATSNTTTAKLRHTLGSYAKTMLCKFMQFIPGGKRQRQNWLNRLSFNNRDSVQPQKNRKEREQIF